MSAPTCARCRSQRWLVVCLRWKDESTTSEWRPFDRGGWDAYGGLTLATALAQRVLAPCPDCNPRKLAPWAQEFRAQAADPINQNPAPVDVGGTPF